MRLLIENRWWEENLERLVDESIARVISLLLNLSDTLEVRFEFGIAGAATSSLLGCLGGGDEVDTDCSGAGAAAWISNGVSGMMSGNILANVAS